MSTPIPKSINLVDFSHMLTVNFKARANDSGPNDAGQATLNQLAAVRTTAEHTIVCLDKGPYWRRSVFADYKKGREREPEYGAIYDWSLERVRKDGYNIAMAPGEEADDILATLARIYADELHCTDIRLITADKDVAQCVNESVRWFSPILGKSGEFDIRDADWVKKKFGNVDWAAEEQEGLWPKDIALALAIMGDTSDKIPGIKGIGIKGAAKLINTYKTIEAMAQACVGAVEAAKMTGKPPAAFWKNYAAGMAELPKWLKLTTLNSEAALELHPLKYLERIEPEPLVAVEPSDADDSSFDVEAEFPADVVEEITTAEEIEWDRVAKETEERQRAELAAALPVDPVKPPEGFSSTSTPGVFTKTTVAAPIIGKDPKADENLRKAMEEREREARTNRHGVVGPDPRVMDSPSGAPKQAAPSSAGTSAPSPSPAPAPGPAPVTPSPAPAVSAEVVPPTQGPPRQSRGGGDEPPIQAIVPFQPPSWELSTQPVSAGQAFVIAAKLHNSRRYLSKHQTADQIAAVILRGRELGVGMMTALDGFHVIQGRPCVSSQLLSALAERDPNHDYTMLVELDDDHAVVEIKHKRQPKPVQWKYTIDEARRLGLLEPSPKTGEPSQWVKRPQTMLAKTAKAIGHRFMFPGSTLGLHSLETETEGHHLVGNDD